MVIYHFNRLIRNRFLWGAFAVIIAFAFVSVDSCSTSGGGSTDAGKIGRKKVSAQTLREMEHYIRQTGQLHNMPAPLIYTQAWERLAAAYAAADLGLAVSPELIKQEILSAEIFAQGFDVNAYRTLIRQHLNMSEREFEAGLANNIAFNMLGSVVGSAAWVAPMELDDTIAVYTDTFTVQHAVVSNIFANAEIDVSEEELLKYYEAHRAEYSLPDRVSVSYIAIPISNYVASVKIDDADVLDYYDSNPMLFTKPAPASTNDTDEVAETVTMTLEEARPTIVAKLQTELAADAAYIDISRTLIDLAVSTDLASVATSIGSVVAATPLFGTDDPLPGIENAAEMREKAFELDPSRRETSFNAVMGVTVVYLIGALSNDVARIPTLKEVEADVQVAAREETRFEKFDALIKETYSKIKAAMAADQTFDAAVSAAGLTATTNYTFTISHGLPQNYPEINTVAREAIKLNPGAVVAGSTPRFGNGVIVSLLTREPGNAMTATFMRDQLRESTERALYSAIFADWTSWNLKNSKFKPTPGSEPVSYDVEDQSDF